MKKPAKKPVKGKKPMDMMADMKKAPKGGKAKKQIMGKW